MTEYELEYSFHDGTEWTCTRRDRYNTLEEARKERIRREIKYGPGSQTEKDFGWYFVYRIVKVTRQVL